MTIRRIAARAEPRAALARSLARLGLALALALAASATTRGDIIDQAYTPNPASGQGFNVGSAINQPLGQSFTPTLTSLNFADLRIGDASSPPGTAAQVEVEIRQGSITGTVLGTATTTIPAGTNPAGTLPTLTRFLFSGPIALTPGSTYVIEAFQIPPMTGSNANFLWYGGPLTASTYPGGTAIVGGVAQPAFDFAFQEGVAVPEPSSLVLATLGAAGFGLVARRGLRRRSA